MIPSEIKYIHERAKAYQMIEDHENAVKDFDAVIKKNPKMRTLILEEHSRINQSLRLWIRN